MRNIPVDPSIDLIMVGVVPHTRDGEPVVNSDGVPVINVSCVRPPSEGSRVETVEVRVPAPGVAKDLAAFQPVRFGGLVAKPWSIDGRNGVAFSAESARAAQPPKAAA